VKQLIVNIKKPWRLDVFWQTFVIWMLITCTLFLLRFFGPTFFITIKARDILFNSSLPWSYVLAIPLWFNTWGYIGAQLTASAVNGLIFAGIFKLLHKEGFTKRHPYALRCLTVGLLFAGIHMLISGSFASPNQNLMVTQSGALRGLILNFPGSIIWLYEPRILTPVNFIFYFAVGALGYAYYKKRISAQIG
jgi:hypothetical protein